MQKYREDEVSFNREEAIKCEMLLKFESYCKVAKTPLLLDDDIKEGFVNFTHDLIDNFLITLDLDVVIDQVNKAIKTKINGVEIVNKEEFNKALEKAIENDIDVVKVGYPYDGDGGHTLEDCETCDRKEGCVSHKALLVKEKKSKIKNQKSKKLEKLKEEFNIPIIDNDKELN
jgi:hypothetical protein